MNFLVADDVGYRFEPDSREPVARASFNRAEMAKTLVSIFEVVQENATTSVAERAVA
jgi:hypothetical protein